MVKYRILELDESALAQLVDPPVSQIGFRTKSSGIVSFYLKLCFRDVGGDFRQAPHLFLIFRL